MSLDNFKAQAHRLASFLSKSGVPVKQSLAYEAVAASHGYRNWNTLHAVADKTETEVAEGVAQRARASHELEGLEVPVWEAFEELLQKIPFASATKKPGIAPAAFRDGRHIFVLELRILEELRAVLTDGDGNRLGSDNPAVDRIIHKSVALALVSAAKKKKWLHTRAQGPLGPESDLWRIRHGRLDYPGVLVMRLPVNYVLKQPNAPHPLSLLDSQPPRAPSAMKLLA
ncbi:hypothetical protein D3C71_24160 [compost metagenome]